MASTLFVLPDLGEGLADAEIVEWHAKIGDQLKQDDPLVSVETDKAVVEVPSPYSGKLVKVFGGAGDIIQVGDPLVEYETERAETKPVEDAGTVVGKVESGNTVVRERAGRINGKEGAEVKVTPAVRALAKRMNVELSVIKPSGPDGVVTAEDVKRVADVLAELGPLAPLRGVRRAMARSMTMAHEQVVPVTLHDDADIDHWVEGGDISWRLIRAIVAACNAEPVLNAWYDSQAVGLRVLDKIDLGVAVDTEEGLFVPVLKDVAALGQGELRQALGEMKTAVESRTIPPEEMRGFSFTLSNFGTVGGRYATLVVVPPSVAILGAGATRDAVVPDGGAAVVHKIMPLSLTFDHRCVTGGEAARFLMAVITDLGK